MHHILVKRAITGTTHLARHVSLLPEAETVPEWDAFETALGLPANGRRNSLSDSVSISPRCRDPLSLLRCRAWPLRTKEGERSMPSRNPLSPILIAIVAAAAFGFAVTSAQTRIDAPVDRKGDLRVPDQYRTTYEHLGSWSLAADDNGAGAQAIHDVYASPGTLSAYTATGDFPEGTVLVKEVWKATTERMTTGSVSRASTLDGWFVMVRDAKGSHRGNALWGDGWGWSWFDAADPLRTTSSDYASDCQGCHVPAEATHRVYVQGYPAMKSFGR